MPQLWSIVSAFLLLSVTTKHVHVIVVSSCYVPGPFSSQPLRQHHQHQQRRSRFVVTNRQQQGDARSSTLQVLFVPQQEDASKETKGHEKEDSSERRMLLSSALCLFAGSVGMTTGAITTTTAKLQNPPLGTTGSALVLSVNDALEKIESLCDRRFLHAVVASDYRLLYRRLPSFGGQERISVFEADSPATHANIFSSKLLDEEKYRIMALHESKGIFAFTKSSNNLVENENEIYSIWPLVDAKTLPTTDADSKSNVRFTWLAQAKKFQDWADINTDELIVDGVDCGRISLEDALETKGKEIFITTRQYLAVPLSMEEELVAKLQSAFLI